MKSRSTKKNYSFLILMVNKVETLVTRKISLNFHLVNKFFIEFYSWKQEEEIRTNSRFIQLRGLRKHCKNGEEISTLKFVCNRSGIFHSKSNGKRAYRIKGSSKIGK